MCFERKNIRIEKDATSVAFIKVSYLTNSVLGQACECSGRIMFIDERYNTLQFINTGKGFVSSH